VATGQVEFGDLIYAELDDNGSDVAFSKRQDVPTISEVHVPAEWFSPFFGAAVQSQQVGAMA
jgi:hypothetical protein